MGGDRLITGARLITGGGSGFGWLTADWEAMLFDNVGLIKAWKSVGFWWSIWLVSRLWNSKSFFCNLVWTDI
jgi:hypothetical protein